ncbi:hypothetical protein LF41_1715 [Lysobacter dokdonensis DS-58]|uniref:Secreted protein n=1 Tax=Lysobacter dokdonensis DS-58 TaxID=1300345 RepID=A0A0A2WCP5_9GAMM|nr:hypothetical protein [Lysobacter dokdonensis]KGQ17861.1 hypothetical protein LF41_1715 [Lysobacter dokdonensis DS-58]
MTSRALLCIALLLGSTGVFARDVHLAGPGGGGGGKGGNLQQCDDVDNAVAAATAKAPAKPRTTVASTQPARPIKVKSVPAARGDTDADAPRMPTPRWHSFLPGMFR